MYTSIITSPAQTLNYFPYFLFSYRNLFIIALKLPLSILLYILKCFFLNQFMFFEYFMWSFSFLFPFPISVFASCSFEILFICQEEFPSILAGDSILLFSQLANVSLLYNTYAIVISTNCNLFSQTHDFSFSFYFTMIIFPPFKNVYSKSKIICLKT